MLACKLICICVCVCVLYNKVSHIQLKLTFMQFVRLVLAYKHEGLKIKYGYSEIYDQS